MGKKGKIAFSILGVGVIGAIGALYLVWHHAFSNNMRYVTMGDSVYVITTDFPYYYRLASDIDTDNVRDFDYYYLSDGKYLYAYECPGQVASGFDVGSFSTALTSSGLQVSDKNGSYQWDDDNGQYGWMDAKTCRQGHSDRFSKK